MRSGIFRFPRIPLEGQVITALQQLEPGYKLNVFIFLMFDLFSLNTAFLNMGGEVLQDKHNLYFDSKSALIRNVFCEAVVGGQRICIKILSNIFNFWCKPQTSIFL